METFEICVHLKSNYNFLADCYVSCPLRYYAGVWLFQSFEFSCYSLSFPLDNGLSLSGVRGIIVRWRGYCNMALYPGKSCRNIPKGLGRSLVFAFCQGQFFARHLNLAALWCLITKEEMLHIPGFQRLYSSRNLTSGGRKEWTNGRLLYETMCFCAPLQDG